MQVERNEGSAVRGGFGQKFMFVAAPMMVTGLMMIFSDVQPAPMPGTAADHAATNESENMTHHVAALEAALQEAQAEAQQKAWKVQALEDALRRGPGPVEAWLDSLGGQKALAITGLVMGVLSILGPSSFVNFFFALVGSAVASLFVAAFANITAGFSGSPFWFDSIWAMTGGRGSALEYVTWAALFSLGMLRWYTGWECGIYAVGDEVELEIEGTFVLEKPLLPEHATAA
mmetsp:Transcript_110748/g.319982  ORF Transcript_110748/g.319982 Transcript_110748/m.319982 type:complete len:231 (+) Transcript_110748:98-790(+)